MDNSFEVAPELRVEGGHKFGGNPADNIKLVEVTGPQPERPHSTGKFSSSLCLILLLFFGCMSLTFEIYAITLDNEWNLLVEGTTRISSISSCFYFRNKTFRLSTSDIIQNDIRRHLFRRSILDSVFVAILTIFLLITTFQLIAHICFKRHPKRRITWILGWLITGGVLNLSNSIILMSLVYNDNKMRYNELIKHIKSYESLFYDLRILGDGFEQIANRKNVTLRHALKIHEQAKALREIFNVCSGSGNKGPVKTSLHYVSIREQSCSFADFEMIGFCPDERPRTAAFGFSLILGLMCWLIAVLIYCVGWTNEDDEIETQAIAHQKMPQDAAPHHVYVVLGGLETDNQHLTHRALDREMHPDLYPQSNQQPYTPVFPNTNDSSVYQEEWTHFVRLGEAVEQENQNWL